MKKYIVLAALLGAFTLPVAANAGDHGHGRHHNHEWERSHHHRHHNHHRHHDHNSIWFSSSYVYAPQPYYYTTYYEPRPVYVVQRPAPVYVAPQPMFSLGLFMR